MTVEQPEAGTPAQTTSSGNRLECRGVTVRFGGLVAVSNVDLAVPPGSIVGLVGPNGAGKSTLFGVLSGLLRPTEGRVFLDGEDVTDSRPQSRADRGLARTFQHPEVFGGLTLRDHLTLAHRVRNAKSRVWSDLFTMGSFRPVGDAESKQVEGLLDLLGLQPISELPALGLPLGSARLLELGRALATSPRVLLLDEPSSGLDSGETEEFEHTLRRVAEDRGISVLLVEHDVELVMRMCSTVNVLEFGALIASGSPTQVRNDPTVRAAYLGEEVDATPADGEPEERMELAETLPAVAQADGTATESGEGTLLLKVTDLCVSYGDAVALSDVSFSLGQGKVLAVLGANGGGKSSLARAISGLVHPGSGSVVFAGQDISRWPADRVRKAGLLHLPEGRGIFRRLSVIDNLRMAVAAAGDRQARREALDTALAIFPVLAERRRQVAGSLSGGEQQMLSLARALATSPRMVIADEMSLGLAPKMVDLVFEGLARARDAGISIIMIEQYVHRALGFADDCVVLQRGQMVWQGPARNAGAEVLSHYLGESLTAAS